MTTRLYAGLEDDLTMKAASIIHELQFKHCRNETRRVT
jgi:hypothetical protein